MMAKDPTQEQIVAAGQSMIDLIQAMRNDPHLAPLLKPNDPQRDKQQTNLAVLNRAKDKVHGTVYYHIIEAAIMMVKSNPVVLIDSSWDDPVGTFKRAEEEAKLRGLTVTQGLMLAMQEVARQYPAGFVADRT